MSDQFKDLAKKLIGTALEEAKKLAQIRIMNSEGESMMGTMDFVPERINVSVKDGMITDAWTG